MIDIHSHILPYVDDGSKGKESSIKMLKDLCDIGVTDVFLTPHYRGKYNLEKDQILEIFNQFKEDAKDVPINLYIGREINIDNESIEKFFKGELLSLNGTKYVLIEFHYHNYFDIVEAVYMLVNKGYIPIVAHPERYEYLELEDIEEIKSIGGLIQINASSLIRKFDKGRYKIAKRLIKEDLVDFVASDHHDFRALYLADAKKVVEKKFGKDVAEDLFYNNPMKIIKG